jgi:formylglycine-generating enzyme required for sulfatase activity
VSWFGHRAAAAAAAAPALPPTCGAEDERTYPWGEDANYMPCAVERCTDPTGPATGTTRVIRGCAFAGEPPAGAGRVVDRDSEPPDNAWDYLGFRCALML